MIVILHIDDQPMWLNGVLNNLKQLRMHKRMMDVEVLSRTTAPEARAVVEGTDQRIRDLNAQGFRLNAAIMDLMIAGGTTLDIRTWREIVKDLASHVTPEELDTLSPEELATGPLQGHFHSADGKCPMLPVGRLAARRGAKVVILTNVGRFQKQAPLSPENEHKLVMAACGASAYLTKGSAELADTHESWLDTLKRTLSELLQKAVPQD